MTNEFLAWFAQHIGDRPFFSEEEKEELKTYTWLAWRDSLRASDSKEYKQRSDEVILSRSHKNR
ncbi:hypothetical protein OUHCRE13_43050 [Enterobacter roggenkampii]|uniref:hypothetical protein n=1 Tax=Enterobacter roggenkampii TaxID=1812935 RepID=UPI0011BA2149|nr:hypothetical protein [Enterobacter roggenkampii]TWY19418.1 hypothetical protein FR969_14770 [Enterobacter roggenkampii]